MTTNILLCGVGGQGTLLASNILAETALKSGNDVKKSEVHGMAQRGGSVVSHVKFGREVFSPLIRKGECDILLSFERLEALRWSEFLRPTGTIIMNDQKILPMSVSAGDAKYPDDIPGMLKKSFAKVLTFDALSKAKELGNAKCVNVVLLGILARNLPMFSVDNWLEVIAERIPPKILEINKKAFHCGWEMAN
ncbi:MAG: indolepyruvate oxidoreductase subunit beta [Candidatus Riflebacteria bacterium]|nr:indolepyruvate oxidoreductase subunit beta [Candidatus Riflebacteria bacterium]